MGVASITAAAARPSSLVFFLRQRQGSRPRWIFTPLASCSSSSSSLSRARKLILYSKPGCCLCDGLKDKLQAALSLSGPHSLHDVDLQVRDITSNPEWERAYQHEIPVLAKILADGTESELITTERQVTITERNGCCKKTLPKLSPRLGVELIQKKIAAAWTQ